MIIIPVNQLFAKYSEVYTTYVMYVSKYSRKYFSKLGDCRPIVLVSNYADFLKSLGIYMFTKDCDC